MRWPVGHFVVIGPRQHFGNLSMTIRALALLLLPLPALAQSDIAVDVTCSTYELDSDTLPDIQAEMNLEGVPTALSGHTVTRILCSHRRHS